MLIPEVPGDKPDELEDTLIKRTQGFSRLFAMDPDMLGFGENINRAMGYVKTPWALIWNDDAYPCFEAWDFAEMLSRLPENIMCAAPALRVREGQVLQRHHWDEYRSMGGTPLDPKQEYVRTHCQITEAGPWWLAQLKPEAGWSKELWFSVIGTGYCPLFAVRTEWFHSLGGFSDIYSPGYYEDAHFWRLTRRFGGETVVIPAFEYEHEGRGTFTRVYTKESFEKHLQENLKRYLLVWGHAL